MSKNNQTTTTTTNVAITTNVACPCSTNPTCHKCKSHTNHPSYCQRKGTFVNRKQKACEEFSKRKCTSACAC